MKTKERKDCPLCGCKIKGYPAISRKDNKTEICSDCGYLEAMFYFVQGFENGKK